MIPFSKLKGFKTSSLLQYVILKPNFEPNTVGNIHMGWDPCLWGYSLSSPSSSAAWISVLRMTGVTSITISFQDLKASAANRRALIV